MHRRRTCGVSGMTHVAFSTDDRRDDRDRPDRHLRTNRRAARPRLAGAHRGRTYHQVVGGYVSLDARPGGRLTERWADVSGREVLTSREVVRLGAPRTLELRWADDWDEPTRVLFRLEEPANTTRLMPEHSGWDAFSTSLRADRLLAHASGWSQHRASLAAYSARTPR